MCQCVSEYEGLNKYYVLYQLGVHICVRCEGEGGEIYTYIIA